MGRHRVSEPTAGDDRGALLGWLAFHRGALEAKCSGLTAEQLVRKAVHPSSLSLLGLVRHLTEMERVYGVYAIGGPRGSLKLVYCTDQSPEADIEGITVDMAYASLEAWRNEWTATDGLIQKTSLDDLGAASRFTVRWNVLKLLQEYARHNGHADLIRQAIDGSVGE